MPDRSRRPILTFLYFVPPIAVGAVGIVLLYRAAELDGDTALRAFLYGVVLLLSACAFVAVRNARRRSLRDTQWESRTQHLACRLRRMEHAQHEMRQEVHSMIALKEWLESMEKADDHSSKNWVQVVRDMQDFSER